MECAEKCRNDAHRLPEARDGEWPRPAAEHRKEQGGYGRNGKAAAGTDGKSHLKHEGPNGRLAHLPASDGTSLLPTVPIATGQQR